MHHDLPVESSHYTNHNEVKPKPLESSHPYLQLSCLHWNPVHNRKWWKSWIFYGGLTNIGSQFSKIRSRFLSSQKLEKLLKTEGRFWHFRAWFWANIQLQNQFQNCIFHHIITFKSLNSNTTHPNQFKILTMIVTLVINTFTTSNHQVHIQNHDSYSLFQKSKNNT